MCDDFLSCYLENSGTNTALNMVGVSAPQSLTITPTSAITQKYRVYCQGDGVPTSSGYYGDVLSETSLSFVVTAPVFDDTTISTST